VHPWVRAGMGRWLRGIRPSGVAAMGIQNGKVFN
jgi:hypothetical protein